MPDDLEKTGESAETKGPDAKPETVSEDELQELRGAKARLDKMEDVAKEMFHDSPEDYIETLEQHMHETTKEPDKKPEAKPAAAPAAAPQTDPELENRVKQSASNSASAIEESQWSGYEVHQMKQPEKERSSRTRDELLIVLKGPKGLVIQELARKDPDFNRNLYLAADYFIDMTEGKGEQRKAGAASADALNAAKTTASLDRGRTIPSAADKSEQDDMAEYMDWISPPDNFEIAS